MSDVANPIILRPALRERFESGWAHGRVLLFSAPCGCGKTAVARALTAGLRVCRFNAAEDLLLWEDIPPQCDAVLVDEVQNLLEQEQQERLCDLIRTRSDLHFLLLSRGTLPGWLTPFQFAGLLQVIGTEDLLLDAAATGRLLASRGVEVSAQELADIHRDFHGYPIALQILCNHLGPGTPYSPAVYEVCKREVFVCYDEMVFRRFAASLRLLLASLSPFAVFTADLAKMVSGNPRAGELLELVQRGTSMLLPDGQNTYHFWTVFRGFLQWKLPQLLNEEEQQALYGRAALYYELHDEPGRALDCYALAGEQHRISELLTKNAEQHPGVGHYREMERYYYALPREEVLRSPSLMCGMSMLTAMNLDFEASEEWYRALQSFGARLQRSDADYDSARGKLAYLDIALPQRGSRGLIETIGSVFRVMSDKQIEVPSFSVTSTLPSIMNGGKDFCVWSRKDDLIYATMRKAVETVLGRDGVGLADCAICESKFEKGEDVSARMLTLMSRLGEIQGRGTPDIEFAVIGLLARIQTSQGRIKFAADTLTDLRAKYQEAGQTRFLPNLDAMLCRIALRTDDRAAVQRWLEEKAPRDDVRLWAMWRYQYLTRAMVQITAGDCDSALLLLARLLPYCDFCGRVMDGLHLRLLMALCRFRQNDSLWQEEFSAALDTCASYRFVWPVAQYGAAVLPLLTACGWKKDAAFLRRLTEAARAQAVFYPHFLRRQTPPADPLSAQETQVLQLLCKGLSNQEIGEILGIKLTTVKTHVSHVLQKLGVSRRAEARAAAEQLQLL